jgi:hypothetical protein
MFYLEWSSKKYHPKDTAGEDIELYDLLGTKSINFPSAPAFSKKKSTLFATKPFQFLLLESNYSLASNQGIKSFDFENKGDAYLSYSALAVGECVETSPIFRVNHLKMAVALFFSSLPDMLSELEVAANTNNKQDAQIGLVNFYFNVPLFIFHAAAQSVQVLCQILSLPTMLTGMALRAAEKENKGSLASIGYMALAVLAAIVTAPFQAFNIISNAIGYARHIVDGVVTVLKAIVNIFFIKFIFDADPLDPKSLQDRVNKNVDLIWYGLTDILKNCIKLIPVAVAATVAFFTAGASLAVAPTAAAVAESAVVASGFALLSQALSVGRIAIGKGLNFLAKKIDKLFSEKEKPESSEAEMQELTSVNGALKNLGASVGPTAAETHHSSKEPKEVSHERLSKESLAKFTSRSSMSESDSETDSNRFRRGSDT